MPEETLSADSQKRLDEWLSTSEPLDPELHPYHVKTDIGWMLYHPRMVALASDDPNEPHPIWTQYNKGIRELETQYDKAVAQRKWAAALLSYTARPFRSQTFDLLAPDMTHTEYWGIASEVWIDQENPEDYTEEWRRRFNALRPYKQFLMEPDEQKALRKLPDPVVVYRADISPTPGGLSWTTSVKVARFFAKRYDSHHPMYRGIIAKQDIAAYWTRRGEDEVLVLKPKALTNIVRVDYDGQPLPQEAV